MSAQKDFVIRQGATFSHTLRWEAQPFIYKAISAITQAAPARVTATGHGVPDGWRAAIVSVKGMTQINAEHTPPWASDYHKCTAVDANTVEFNGINSSEFKAYTSGGYLQFLTPVDMTNFTARMKIKNKVGGTVLASTEAADTPLDIIEITIDNAAKTITLSISATDTEAITWTRGVYDLEMVSQSGIVTELLTGNITVSKEVTV